ncbi:hypothetical protein K2173_021780 [Erythroxylum novogranatense]|uniref:Uncharacterized protein n=1 Tax=Erythroxylum novogranatense TaxID=1862640 RepID=A0AAV8TYE2_9ROSI|nr:hypothetical protein K2173_021780 [Erythroxylum novogranatense]
MRKKIVSRRELLDRWRGIEEEEEEDDGNDVVKTQRVQKIKEEWFVDAFNFLICLPKETHIWCASWDLMGPLLETFYNYFKDERHDSSLKLLWKRISGEMRQCIQCISQHHQAQETYNMEYESSSIGPLLDVLRTLDEERITEHLREMNAKLKREEYDPLCDNGEVVTIMYEVLMFPSLLDDQSLIIEFELFIEAVDNMHELALAGHQQFPGIYALLFFSRRVRTVGRRLARSMEKLRRATDLEPLQPLLNKFIVFLETEVMPSACKATRPRSELDRLSVWLGFTSLFEFLEPPVFEEGIMERYPIFFDIVLNHISGDSSEFSVAVNCLKELFKMLGCKLWLRSTLSPSVMRNTLLGQCFHTRNEKMHIDIFDLFPPFLQSLEALQDGEHEKQRRHFLYFLLHQVPASSNFNVLTLKMACKIALLIVHRGYTMNPSCPPSDCAHMWGPSLVSSLRDTSLHCSLRQPAFDLIQTIIVSDAAALTASLFNNSMPVSDERIICSDWANNNDEIPFALGVEEKDPSCWTEFNAQSKVTVQEHSSWMCIPMLWVDVLVDIDPSVLPVSFSKAVFWARSRLVMVEPDTSVETELQVRSWLLSFAIEITGSLGWKVPTGYDDGGVGKESKNSVKVLMMHLPLVRAFNRFVAHFLVKMGQGELRKQWTWEPRMAESLILLLVDPNDHVRQFSKCILEQVSNTRGLSSGLKFLSSCLSSLSAVLLGLRYALQLVQLDSVLLKFQTLQNFLFVLCKLIKGGDSSNPVFPKKSSDDISFNKYSSQGGFLMQPVFDSLTVEVDGHSTSTDFKLLEKFQSLLSQIAWPSIERCLVEGKAFIDSSPCQMTCVRVLEILPVVFERLCPSSVRHPVDSVRVVKNVFDFMWLHDLIDWGKSSLKVVVVYWRKTVGSLMKLLIRFCSKVSAFAMDIENLISCDIIDMDQLAKQVSHLRVMLSKEASSNIGMVRSRDKASSPEGSSFVRRHSNMPVQPIELEDTNVQVADLIVVANRRDKSDVIVLSDDEAETHISPVKVNLSSSDAGHSVLDENKMTSLKTASQVGILGMDVPGTNSSKDELDTGEQKVAADGCGLISQKLDVDKLGGKPAARLESEGREDKGKEVKPKGRIDDSLSSQYGTDLRSFLEESVKSLDIEKVGNNLVSEARDSVLKDLVRDSNNKLVESFPRSVRPQQLNATKLVASGFKRQVIQLGAPSDTRFGNLHRREAIDKRFKPPRLDEWYRQILEIDYFSIVGLATASENTKQTSKLKEVPVCFQSPKEYVDIFRPLVLEEFKAQLHSCFLEISSWEEIYNGSLSVLSVERIDDFHHVRFVHDDHDSSSSKSFVENDLVLLTKEVPQNKSHDLHMVGKVERRERDNNRRASILLTRFYFPNGSPRLNQARRQLVERSKWHASRIMNITPQLREFQALSSLKDIPILSVILNPSTGSSSDDKSRKLALANLSQPLQQILKASFNESQLQAISVAFGSCKVKKDFELTLIQGPPGTGKTRTIVAIVSVFLASLEETNNPKIRRSKQDNDLGINTRTKISQSVAIARAWQDAALARQLNENEKTSKKSPETSTRRRVLICAQSNAAVDELVSRISVEGLYGSEGKMYKPYLVRVGNAKTVHQSSLPFYIDTLVEHRLAEEKMHLIDAKNDLGRDSSTTLRSNLEKLVDRIRYYEAKRANLRDGNSDHKSASENEMQNGDDGKEMSDAELEAKLRILYEQKKQMYRDLSAAQAQEKKTSEEIKMLKNKLRKLILKEAEIIVTTLSGCGGDLFGVCSESMSNCKFGNPSEHALFDVVIIDEAAQALEPATLIPLQLLKSNGTKCIMVGDPKQLPATVLSNVASKFLYACSMFERLQRAGHPVTMLTQQYRMHPEICQFPSLHFYEGKLLNGGQLSSKSAPFHETEGLGPYVFYDIIDGLERHGKNSGALSLYNEHEAEAAVELLRFFKKRHPSEFVGGRIGIITPYKCQLSLLRSHFSNALGSHIIADMEFNTVDGFQGREVDILILSTVRASNSCSTANGINFSSIGFVADVRRMNVALTRAKLSLWILGNSRTLQSNHNWAALVKDAKERNLIISVKRPYKSFKSSIGDKNSSENADSHCGNAKGSEHCRDTKKMAQQNEWKGKDALQKKRISAEDQSKGKVSSGVRDFVRKADDVHYRKKRPGDAQTDQDKKDVHSADTNCEKRLSKNGDSTTSEQVAYDENKGKDRIEKKLISGSSYMGGRKDKFKNLKYNPHHFKQERSVGNKKLEMDVLKQPKKHLERDLSQRNSEVSVSSSGSNQKVGEVKDDRALNHSTTKDLITKRKQQRQEVDAILFSSLISSKKPEPSSKSVPPKRAVSPASLANGSVRPPKIRKGQSDKSSKNLIQDQR